MVQVETSQLSGECNTWREKLRHYRDEFSKDKKKLQDAASQQLSKDQLRDVEHLHNQFHIQLINIHDLKHAIKTHEHKMNHEKSVNKGMLHAETLAEHENLLDQYQSLDLTLQELREEFDRFLSKT
jgi:DNA-binding GntR family transcriptional regulator